MTTAYIYKRMRPVLGNVLWLIGAGALALGARAVADEPNPYAMEDESWITISGVVQDVQRDRFTLDFGDSVITVEMDDGDRDADAYKLVTGDKVTVAGRIDDDFYELAKIEASSVFVQDLGTTFFASPVDTESAEGWAAAVTIPVDVADTVVRGTVTAVGIDTFKLDSGVRELTVDVSDMPYDPLDDQGYQRIGIGDRVQVTGEIGNGFFAGRQLSAESVAKLNIS